MAAKKKSPLAAPRRRARRPAKRDIYDLRLYVAGQSPRSLAAFANLKQLCEMHLSGKYRIEVIDLMKKPHRAREDEVIAVPTLVRRLPEPIRKIIGDLCDVRRTLRGLDVFADERNGTL